MTCSPDYITVNENAADPPMETEKDNINSPGSLSLEATYVDHNFSFQAVREDQPLDLPKPNPFYGPEETEPLASCAYRYRLFDLSINEEESFHLLARTQVDAYIPGTSPGKEQYVTLKTLNEFDSRAQGAGGAPDWRSKLDSQRGAVVSTEMKNNSAKLAKWAVQAILAGADAMKIGYDILFHLSISYCSRNYLQLRLSSKSSRDYSSRHPIDFHCPSSRFRRPT